MSTSSKLIKYFLHCCYFKLTKYKYIFIVYVYFYFSYILLLYNEIDGIEFNSNVTCVN